jgi:hypothetical protein
MRVLDCVYIVNCALPKHQKDLLLRLIDLGYRIESSGRGPHMIRLSMLHVGTIATFPGLGELGEFAEVVARLGANPPGREDWACLCGKCYKTLDGYTKHITACRRGEV